jgi:hypothetical protein
MLRVGRFDLRLMYFAELIRRIAKHAVSATYRCLPRLVSVFYSLGGDTRLSDDILRAVLKRF